MDQEKADSINGVAIDWETIQELDLSKGLNTKEEAIGYILEVFFVVDEEGMPLTELIEQPVFQYIEADFKDVKAGTFGKENLVLKGRNKEWHVRIARKYEDIPEIMLAAETEEVNYVDENPVNFKGYPSGSRIKFRRGLSDVVGTNIYLHSGILLQVKNSKEEPMVIELVNSEKECTIQLNPLGKVVKRGNYSLNYFRIDNTYKNNNTMVLKEHYTDFLMTVYGLTANLTWTYDVVRFNCHHVSLFLVSGVFGSSENDKTVAQWVSEKTGIMLPIQENKPLAQVGLKELVSILYLKGIKKRNRLTSQQGTSKLIEED